jgi:hypothetical protein
MAPSASETRMTDSDPNNPYGFNLNDLPPPGAIAVPAEALDRAREFSADLRKSDGDPRWIATFAWAYQRKYRPNPTAEWVDEGPGVDLCGYKSSELPPGVVEVRDGLPVAFIIPRDKVASAIEKKIVETKLVSGVTAYKLV